MVSNPSSVRLDYDSCWRRYSLSTSPSPCPPQLIQGASEGERNANSSWGSLFKENDGREFICIRKFNMIHEDGRRAPNVVV